MERSELAVIMKETLSTTIAYHPILAHGLGNANAGLLLSQLLYWSGRGYGEDGWIYKTADQWQFELGLTRHELKSARELLVAAGVVLYETRGANNKGHYKVDYEGVAALSRKAANHLAAFRLTTWPESGQPLGRKAAKSHVSPSLYTKTTPKTIHETTANTTCADDHSEYFKPAKKKKTLTGEQLMVKQAMTIFANLARLNESHKWLKDITSQLQACQMDVTKWEQYAKETLAYMDASGLTYTKPASVTWGIERLASGKPLDGRKVAVASQADDDFAEEIKRRRELQQ